MKELAMRILLVGGLVMAALALAPPARAQIDSREGIALQNQILELKHELQTMRDGAGAAAPAGGSAVYTGAPRPAAGTSDLTAQLLERVMALESQMRVLSGRIDEIDNAAQRRDADLAKQLADLQFKLDNGGAAAGKPAVPVASAPAAPAAAPAAVKRTPALALQEGNAALARRDYATAEAAAREVLAGAKGTPAAYDAQFLLAEASQGARNYPQAAIAYNDAYDRSRKGVHAQDSLLGLANSLISLNEKRSACAALDTLRSQFPSPRPDVVQRAAHARSLAGCP
jgi:TolA-binding protein